jgi:FimV-like protein
MVSRKGTIFKPLIKNSSVTKIDSSNLEPKLELTSQKISSKEIETMWSVAKSVQDNFDASIYQIMWAFYLENPNAFIDDNINLIRKDIDLTLPSPDLVQSTNNMDAKASISFMSSLPRKIAPISGRQLILTAPASLLNQTEALAAKSEDSLNSTNSQAPKLIANSNLSGSEIIKTNTSIISLNNAAPSIAPKSKVPSRAFQLTDLIWVGLLSLILGFVIAFMLIRFNKKPSFTKTAVEEDFQQDDSSIFQSNLSVSNDIEIQELDLVRTYIDMGDWNNAEIILEKLIAISTDPSILSSAKELLNQKK